MTLPDIQSEPDGRGIELDAVGIQGLRYPVTFTDGVTTQGGIADVELTVRLAATERGTHMSRMVEIAERQLQLLDPREFPATLKTAAHHLAADEVAIGVSLPFATRVAAPATGATAWQAHDLTIRGSYAAGAVTVETTVATDVTSLCPCSKAISDYGAHNQRSRVTLTVIGYGDDPYPVDVADAVALLTGCGSFPVIPLVKRPDERVLTMRAYENPMFVEDMARTLSAPLRERSLAHRIEIRNIESIHSHDAIARVTFSLSA